MFSMIHGKLQWGNKRALHIYKMFFGKVNMTLLYYPTHIVLILPPKLHIARRSREKYFKGDKSHKVMSTNEP